MVDVGRINLGQSLVKNYIHLVFSTKYREPLIQSPNKQELYNYLGGICKRLECYPITIGGYTDHIHILCRISKKIALIKLVEEVKSHSSKWMKTKDDYLKHFYWQNGYGAFSVNPANMDKLIKYIENQYEHHSKKKFQVEYRKLLEKHKIKFNEKYVWD